MRGRPPSAALLVALAATTTLGWADPARAATASLTFAEAYECALRHATVTRSAASAVAAATLERELAEAQDDPALELNAAASARYAETVESLPFQGDAVTRKQSYGITAAVPLYDFGRQAAREARAEAGETLAKVNEATARAALKHDVARAYMEAVTAERAAAVAAEQARAAEAKAEVQSKNYRSGLRPEMDLVQAQVEAGRAGIARQKAEDELHAARLRLASLTGVEDPRPATTELPGPDAILAITRSWQTPGRSLLAERQDLERRALATELDAAGADRRPTLDALITAERTGQWMPLATGATGQLRLSWELPWSGKHRDREELAAEKLRAAALTTEAETRRASDQVRASKDALAANARIAEALAAQKSLAERQLKLVQTRYDSGRASALEVTTAEVTLLGVRLDLVRIHHDAALRALEIAEARDITSVEGLFP